MVGQQSLWRCLPVACFSCLCVLRFQNHTSLEITSCSWQCWLCWLCWFWHPTGVNFQPLILRFHVVMPWSTDFSYNFYLKLLPVSWFLLAWNGTSLLKNIFPRPKCRVGIQQTCWKKWTNDLQVVIFLDVFSFFRSCFTRCNLTWVHSLGGGWTNTPILGEMIQFEYPPRKLTYPF